MVNLLEDRGETLSIVETFTGGELTSRLNRFPSSLLIQSIITGDASRFCPLGEIDNAASTPDAETAVILANKIRARCKTSIGLAVVGVLREMKKDYEVDAHIVVSGKRVNGSYRWKMGADISSLRIRGAIIALNTLRLALIS